MWSGLQGIFGGLFGGSSQAEQIKQQNLANQLGSLGGIIPYGLKVPIITPPAAPALAAYEEDSKPEIETIEEPDGSIVVKGK